MIEPATLSTTLMLDGLKDPGNAIVWSKFDARYRPLIEAIAKRMGLRGDEAMDAAQQTMMDFAIAYRAGKYSRGRGRLRSFLLSIARHRAVDVMRARKNVLGDGLVENVPDEPTVEEFWTVERRKTIALEALARLREESRLSESNINAFELLVLHGKTPDEVAVACGITSSQVYTIKNRIAPRLRAIIDEITAAFDMDD
jgi:RNA polymerase sigma factor (sigma-70 family)